MNFKILRLLFFTLFFLPVSAQKTEPVKIGLLIQDKSSLAALQGAELAVKMANEKGGPSGRSFQLVIKDMEGPWGTGSKKAVELIFEDKVWAILGSHDGRNAHLVEQACTKAQVVFLSAWSSDPTLSQAFVPWFFNCVPNDNQQAAALANEIFGRSKINNTACISDKGYDAQLALKCFVKEVNVLGQPAPLQYFYETGKENYGALVDQISKENVNGYVFFGKPSATLEIIRLLRQKKKNQPVFGSLTLLDDNEVSDSGLKAFEGFSLLSPAIWAGSAGNPFRETFNKAYGHYPGVIASYAFDGMNMLIEAIRIAGTPDRERIQQSLFNLHHQGVTGPIQFDSKGNRVGDFYLMRIKNGIPVRLSH